MTGTLPAFGEETEFKCRSEAPLSHKDKTSTFSSH